MNYYKNPCVSCFGLLGTFMIPQDHQNRRTQVSCLLAVKLILSMVENSGFGLRFLIVKRGEAGFGV